MLYWESSNRQIDMQSKQLCLHNQHEMQHKTGTWILGHGSEAMENFANLYLEELHNGETDPTLVPLSSSCSAGNPILTHKIS